MLGGPRENWHADLYQRRVRLAHPLWTAGLGPPGFCFWTVSLMAYHEHVSYVERDYTYLSRPSQSCRMLGIAMSRLFPSKPLQIVVHNKVMFENVRTFMWVYVNDTWCVSTEKHWLEPQGMLELSMHAAARPQHYHVQHTPWSLLGKALAESKCPWCFRNQWPSRI